MWIAGIAIVIFLLIALGLSLAVVAADADELAMREWERRRRELGGDEK